MAIISISVIKGEEHKPVSFGPSIDVHVQFDALRVERSGKYCRIYFKGFQVKGHIGGEQKLIETP